jgi:hypothetical protein
VLGDRVAGLVAPPDIGWVGGAGDLGALVPTAKVQVATAPLGLAESPMHAGLGNTRTAARVGVSAVVFAPEIAPPVNSGPTADGTIPIDESASRLVRSCGQCPLVDDADRAG